MSSMNTGSWSTLSPLRIGAILRLIRLSYGDCTVEEMTGAKQDEVIKSFDIEMLDDNLSMVRISRPNWNAYENGTRLVSIDNLNLVTKIIQAFLVRYRDTTWISINRDNIINKEAISSQIKKSWTRERIISSLAGYCEIQSVATRVLAGYFASPAKVEDYDREKLALWALSDWLGGRVTKFQSYFALTLVLRQRYMVKNKGSRKKQYKKIEAFRKDALAGDISFNHPGPAMDVILSFCDDITYKIDTHEISLGFRDNDGKDMRLNIPVTGGNYLKVHENNVQ